MRIQHYDFGTITIDGVKYHNDLKIVGGKVISNWWRKRGHNLEISDISDILEALPNTLIVGTGYSGLMEVSKEAVDECKRKGIELIALPTSKACEEFNRRASTKVAFAAHLTC